MFIRSQADIRLAIPVIFVNEEKATSEVAEAEPWLRGPLEGVHPAVMPVFFTFTQVREDLARQCQGLTLEELWRNLDGAASVGFHLKHIAGRLTD